MTTKLVGYSYPTSTYADEFGYKHGGYYVAIKGFLGPEIPIAMFATEDEAYMFADAVLHFKYYKFDLRTFKNREVKS